MTTLRSMLATPTVWDPRVAPDGSHVAWLSTASGRPAVHVAPTDGGPVRTLARDALAGHPADAFRWTLDSEGVWLLRVPDDDHDRTALCRVSLADERESVTELGERTWLVGPTTGGVVVSDWDRTVADSGDLAVVDPTTGRRDRLTRYGARPDHAVVAPDGRLAYVVPASESAAHPAGTTVVRSPDGTVTRLGERLRPVDWCGDRLLLADDGRAVVASDGSVEPVGVSNGERVESGESVQSGERVESGESVESGDGVPVGFLDAHRVLVLRESTPVVLPAGDRVACEPVAAGDAAGGRAGFTASDPPRVVGWDGTESVRLASPTPPVSASLATPDRVTVPDSTGEPRDAWLSVPGERPAPCVVHLYGFRPEAGAFDRKFGRAFRFLHDCGYAILVPAHGGDRFDDRRHADYAAAARWVTDRAWSDGAVAAVGHSSGGYDALCQADRYPEAWTATVAYNPITDYRAFYDTVAKSRDVIRDHLGDASLDRLAAVSPDTPRVPTLVVEGEHDPVVEQVRAFVADAREADAPVTYEEVAGTGHWTRDLDVRVRIWRRIETFLDRTLVG